MCGDVISGRHMEVVLTKDLEALPYNVCPRTGGWNVCENIASCSVHLGLVDGIFGGHLPLYCLPDITACDVIS